jgi:hypothetical protein
VDNGLVEVHNGRVEVHIELEDVRNGLVEGRGKLAERYDEHRGCREPEPVFDSVLELELEPEPNNVLRLGRDNALVPEQVGVLAPVDKLVSQQVDKPELQLHEVASNEQVGLVHEPLFPATNGQAAQVHGLVYCVLAHVSCIHDFPEPSRRIRQDWRGFLGTYSAERLYCVVPVALRPVSLDFETF